MPEGQPLEFSGVSKRFGAVTAVSDLSARVEPGRVTGFLGPNGAGKTTTLRILLGLVRPTSGSATIGGVRYADLPRPLQTVGAVLEASSFHPGRTAAAHLTVYAQAAGVPRKRVDEVLGLVGLSDAAGRKIGGFSLGMRQRLGLAYALLGDPGVLVLDEPTNGLDPEGIRWIRGFLRELAREGRTVLISSHLLAEVQQTVDALLILSQGRLVFEGTLDELSDPTESATVVDSPDRAALVTALQTAGVPFEVLRSGLTVRGVDPAAVGRAAADAGVALSALQRRGPALEEVFLELVDGRRVHPSALGGARTTAASDAAAGEPEPEAEALQTDVPASEPEPEAGAAGEGLEPEPEAEAAGEGLEPESAVETASVPPEPSDTRTASFAVASTGVIDVVPSGAFGGAGGAADVAASDLREDADADVEALGEIDELLSGSEPIAERDEQAPATSADAPIDDLPEDADPDVEALGEIDEELSAPEESDRPWESKVKTDADHDADRFFAAFDTGGSDDVDAVSDDASASGSDDRVAAATDDHEHPAAEGGDPR